MTEATTTVRLTATDLTMLLWGAETVTWAGKENEDDWNAAIRKLERADKRITPKDTQHD